MKKIINVILSLSIILGLVAAPLSAPGSLYETVSAGISRITKVNCPVDVFVYDSKDKLRAAFVDGKALDIDENVVFMINENGEMEMRLPANEDFRLEIIATGDGEMNFSINENIIFDDASQRFVNYEKVPIKKGDMFTAYLPKLTPDEILYGITDGSSADYILTDSTSREVLGKEDIAGSELKNYVFNVTVNADNKCGYVTGEGAYIKGSYVKVKATPVPGSRFFGWYDGNVLVSTDKEYRFAVAGDVDLLAKFSYVEFHDVTVRAGTGGTVKNEDVSCTVTSVIGLIAMADEGYRFKEWTVSAGTVDQPYNAYAWYIMPDAPVTITAVFEPLKPGVYEITLKSGEGGTVSGGGVYESGTTVALIATPDNGNKFGGWYDNRYKVAGAGASYSFTATTDRKLYALFVPEGASSLAAFPVLFSDPYAPDAPVTPAASNASAASRERMDSTDDNAYVNPFTDVNAGDWFYDYVAYVYQNGLMLGTGASPMVFSPNMPLTRGMAVTVLHRLAGTPAISGSGNTGSRGTVPQLTFSDVPAGQWYADAVAWAAANGIVVGYGNGRFGPDDNVTREQLAVLFRNYTAYTGHDPSGNAGAPKTFADSKTISEWARSAVQYCSTAGIITGKPGNVFDPLNDATRAEYAAMLSRTVIFL